jgi:hypothetical protein
MKEMVPLDNQSYQTPGSTTLLGSIGRSIDQLGAGRGQKIGNTSGSELLCVLERDPDHARMVVRFV